MGGMSWEANKKVKETAFTWHVRGAELVARVRSRYLLLTPGASVVPCCNPLGLF